MAQEMNVFRKEYSVERAEVQSPSMSSGPRLFAIHALACLQLHDEVNAESDSGNISIARIAAGDSVLTNPRDVHSLYLLRAFGRHAVPVFQRLLKEEYRMDDLNIEEDVSLQYAVLKKSLGDLG